jgi:hypothetical protein
MSLYLNDTIRTSRSILANLFPRAPFNNSLILRLGSYPNVTRPLKTISKETPPLQFSFFQPATTRGSGAWPDLYPSKMVRQRYRQLIFNALAQHDASKLAIPCRRNDTDTMSCWIATSCSRSIPCQWQDLLELSHVRPPRFKPRLPDLGSLPSSSSWNLDGKVSLEDVKYLLQMVLVLLLERFGVRVDKSL